MFRKPLYAELSRLNDSRVKGNGAGESGKTMGVTAEIATGGATGTLR
jgi:hypothetical protein